MDVQMWRMKLAPYELAVEELLIKFRHLAAEAKEAGRYSYIEKVEGRVKSLSSILDKANQKNIPVDEVTERLIDIAGIRITCQFNEDIQKVVEMIRSRKDMKVVTEKDYLNHAKASGYRSYHVIVSYEVVTLFGVKKILVEIQIRTMAMNFWATIEHSLQYKYAGNVPEPIRERLSNAARAVAMLDDEMSSIRHEILDAQNIFRTKATVAADITNTIQMLYQVENHDAVENIQDEFYDVFENGTMEDLIDFGRRLDAIASRYAAQRI